MPLYHPAEQLPEQSAVERDFFKSLSFLINHYNIKIEDYSTLPYPYSILMTERAVNHALKAKGRHRQLLTIEQEDGRTCLTVKETFNNDFGLYYIPVMPIYDLWQNPKHEKCAELLTAVCAYLYAEAGVSYYRDEDDYMYYNYECMEEWINDREQDEDEQEDSDVQRVDWENAKSQGDFIQEKMMAKGFRQSIDGLIADFCALTEFEVKCLKVAKTAWDLWQSFPEMTLYKHASLQDYEPDDYDDNYIGMHEYFSFVGSIHDSISDDLRTMVNDDFNERTRYQEPEIVTFFNEPKAIYTDELAYEERLLNLIEDLATLLDEKP